MGDMIYREARLEEYEKIGKLLANSFLDYPFLTIIRDDLKKPDYYPNFVETLQTMLTRVYIKKGNCLVAEQDGELRAVALFATKGFLYTILSTKWRNKHFSLHSTTKSF